MEVYRYRPYNGIHMGVTFLFSLLLAAGTARADLREKFQEELALNPDTTPIGAKVADAVRSRPVVMVAGILNEQIPGYFADNARTLTRDFGQKEVRRFFPPSRIRVEENAREVGAWIRKTFEDFGGKPVIVLAHSKGANETLLAVLEDPSLLRDGVIDRLVFIQAAMNGSHIADMLLDNDAGNFPAAQPFHWLFHDWQGLWSLTTREAGPTLARALASADPADRELLDQRLAFVRAAQVRQKCSWQLQAMHLFIDKVFSEDSDGVMVPKDQLIPGLGTDLGVVEGDHFDLTEKGPAVVTPAPYRRAFTRALMRELFE